MQARKYNIRSVLTALPRAARYGSHPKWSQPSKPASNGPSVLQVHAITSSQIHHICRTSGIQRTLVAYASRHDVCAGLAGLSNDPRRTGKHAQHVPLSRAVSCECVAFAASHAQNLLFPDSQQAPAQITPAPNDAAALPPHQSRLKLQCAAYRAQSLTQKLRRGSQQGSAIAARHVPLLLVLPPKKWPSVNVDDR